MEPLWSIKAWLVITLAPIACLMAMKEGALPLYSWNQCRWPIPLMTAGPQWSLLGNQLPDIRRCCCCSLRSEEVYDGMNDLHLVGFFIYDHEEDGVNHGSEPVFWLIGLEVAEGFQHFCDPGCYGFWLGCFCFSDRLCCEKVTDVERGAVWMWRGSSRLHHRGGAVRRLKGWRHCDGVSGDPR